MQSNNNPKLCNCILLIISIVVENILIERPGNRVGRPQNCYIHSYLVDTYITKIPDSGLLFRVVALCSVENVNIFY